jgi:lysophospholipase L1-like esterase
VTAVKGFLLRLLLVFSSLVVTVGVLEIALRMLGHHGAPQSLIDNAYLVDDPVLDWRYVPSSVWSEGNITYRYNSAGFRDVEHEIAKPPGTRRIVVVGDSVTEGIWVDWESTFTGVLQSRLRGEYEVVAVAQSGLNTPQEIHLLEQDGLRYSPDLVVINFVLNDCDFYTRFAAAQQFVQKRDSTVGLFFDMPIDPRVKRALKSSALVYFVKQRGEELMGRLRGVDEGDYFERIWNTDANRAKVTTGFDRLSELSQQHGFGVVVIIWPLVTRYDRYAYESIHNWVREAAEQRGLPVLDLLPRFRTIPFRDLQVTAEDNVHPNARGHRIAADVFLEWLGSRREVPAATRSGLPQRATDALGHRG